MAERYSEAVWEGNLRDGRGEMKTGSGTFQGNYTYASRWEDGTGTNPEELIGAAHAGCFSMAFSNELDKAGFKPRRIFTRAQVTFGKVDGKSRITRIHLTTEGDVPGISAEQFQELAQQAKTGCPVSVALQAVEITMDARLVNQ